MQIEAGQGNLRMIFPKCNVKTSDIVRILMSQISAGVVFFLFTFFYCTLLTITMVTRKKEVKTKKTQQQQK